MSLERHHAQYHVLVQQRAHRIGVQQQIVERRQELRGEQGAVHIGVLYTETRRLTE